MTTRTIENRDLLATCWTWSGDAQPAAADESSPVEIGRRLAAVREAGWRGVGIVHADLYKIVDQLGFGGFKQALSDHGIETVQLEFISNWWTEGDLRVTSDKVRDELFAACAELGADTIKVGSELTSFGVENPVTRERFAESFDSLATRAGQHGVRVAVEPMPMSNITTIVEGAALMREIGNPHGGLVVDTWHVARGGTSYQEMVDVLPMDHVFVVELDDADEQVVGSLWEDTIHHRRMPGDGAIDTAAFIAAMHDAGWRGIWGVEIISEELRAMSVEDATKQVFDKTTAAIEAAEQLPAFKVPTRS